MKMNYIKIAIVLFLINILWMLRKLFKIKSYGLGILSSKINEDFIFKFRNINYIFHPKAARSYCFTIIGVPNEPETFILLDKLLTLTKDVRFIDIGASIGEFVFPIASYKNVTTVYAFEPHPDSYDALKKRAII